MSRNLILNKSAAASNAAVTPFLKLKVVTGLQDACKILC